MRRVLLLNYLKTVVNLARCLKISTYIVSFPSECRMDPWMHSLTRYCVTVSTYDIVQLWNGIAMLDDKKLQSLSQPSSGPSRLGAAHVLRPPPVSPQSVAPQQQQHSPLQHYQFSPQTQQSTNSSNLPSAESDNNQLIKAFLPPPRVSFLIQSTSPFSVPLTRSIQLDQRQRRPANGLCCPFPAQCYPGLVIPPLAAAS